MSLSVLPNELILLIISKLSVTNLFKFRRVNQTWKFLCEIEIKHLQIKTPTELITFTFNIKITFVIWDYSDGSNPYEYMSDEIYLTVISDSTISLREFDHLANFCHYTGFPWYRTIVHKHNENVTRTTRFGGLPISDLNLQYPLDIHILRFTNTLYINRDTHNPNQISKLIKPTIPKTLHLRSHTPESRLLIDISDCESIYVYQKQ